MGCCGQLSAGEDNRVPLLHKLTWTQEWWFSLNNSVLFPFSTEKKAFKAKNGSESSERFIQSIYYEQLSAATGRRGCHHHAQRQRSKQKPEETRDGGLIPKWVGICSHQTSSFQARLSQAPSASLKMQRGFILHRLRAHTAFIIYGQVFCSKKETGEDLVETCIEETYSSCRSLLSLSPGV